MVKEEPDWDADDADVDMPEESPKPLDVPGVCQQDEVMVRVVELLEEQRLALVAKSEERGHEGDVQRGGLGCSYGSFASGGVASDC